MMRLSPALPLATREKSDFQQDFFSQSLLPVYFNGNLFALGMASPVNLFSVCLLTTCAGWQESGVDEHANASAFQAIMSPRGGAHGYY
ncbi:hypothetical protein EVC62_17285 [Salinicola endophyticus]|uniref:Uncharacterized protein n=1 Tax=Salinicola endophyticus TaxID=1949083 RepID=A0ABY8FJY2_9GAMM|nr:hypothetical protein [Salinicola endophyticus]WFF43100.1 hypothetical protein EVC62_17285 [Salinicola endophyticus]